MTNPVSNHDMKVFTGLSNPELSKRLGRYCGVTVSSAEFSLYNNGESDVDIHDSVRGKNVYIVQSSGRDTNNHLMGLLLFVQACKLAGARRITAVLPLIPYARGDHKQADKRKPIAAKLIAGMLEVSGVQQVITVDIHSPQTEGFFSIPVDCLTARFLFERWIKENVPDWQETVVCSPDEGGTRRAGILAEKLHLPMALIHKESFNEDHIISGNVHDKKVLLIDDLADTCYTLLNAVTQLVRVGGARAVYVFVTHAVMSQMPQDLFCCPELIKMVVTNTVNQDYAGYSDTVTEKLVVIDVSEIIGEAISFSGEITTGSPSERSYSDGVNMK